MTEAREAAVDDIVALLPPLMHTLEALGFIARYFNPADFDAVMEAAGRPDDVLRAERPRLDRWPDEIAHIRKPLQEAADAALAGFDGLRAAPEQADSLRAAFRALRYGPRAQEALYPLAAMFPPVSSFFLDPAKRDDEALLACFDQLGPSPDTGVIHVDNEPGSRGGFSLYVPEYYTPDRRWPLVVALHGGSGNGRAFLWSWLRDARAYGAIVAAPTATGDTWALMGEDTDTPNLKRIVDLVQSRWSIDPTKLLLTGMSDGGTFSYVSGFETASPFTHLAPVAASFHPFLAEMADAERLRGLPIFLVHGKHDWMFHVTIARQAQQALQAAGANVVYRELGDLSHTYPRELNAEMLRWLGPAG
ncbi:phospholipase [Afipia sp. P52-10]|uniref:phospholipase n=1 Tax=Afipia sp. P52-10 TaxID=1429916 RepID=UPI0003DF441D|nr:phospholipase [Afipia sp. P52-10]ETR77314.1 phospholipase [Afipia sp. P52-10]